MIRFVSIFLTLFGLASAQSYFGCLCSTNISSATAPNNSQKLAFRSEIFYPFTDTITLVFQSNESIYIAYSGNGYSSPWSRPVPLYPGKNPAITFGRDGDRHLAWEMVDTSGIRNIFYRNLEYRMMPLNVSCASRHSSHPDLFADSLGVAHIVWAEGGEIWYRTANENGLIGERFCLATSPTARFSLPSIEKFGETLNVTYLRLDSTLNRPYAIMRSCQVNGVWQPPQILIEHSRSLNHPTLDFSPGWETFSSAFEIDLNGNLEAQFFGGNGGGYPTFGISTSPVLSTVGTTWSYLFWEEDSAGRKDIYLHFYYFMIGWYARSSLRRWFLIDEPVFAPNCLGALLVWTQGDTAPYKLMWGFFGYPIGIEERRVQTEPAVFGRMIQGKGSLFDLNGRKVKEITSDRNDTRNLPPGVYLLLEKEGLYSFGIRKVIIPR